MHGDSSEMYEKGETGANHERPLYERSPQRAGDTSSLGDAVQQAEETAREDPHAQRIRELQETLIELHGRVEAIAEDLPKMTEAAGHLTGFLESLGGIHGYPSRVSYIKTSPGRELARQTRSLLSDIQHDLKRLGDEIGRTEAKLAALRGNAEQMAPESPVSNPGQERIDEIMRELERMQNSLPGGGR